MIASGQALEFGFATGEATGVILQNLIPYAAARSLGWLTLDPTSGVVAPGGHLDIALEIDGTLLLGGDYRANVAISSDDSLAGVVRVPVHVHVSGVPQMTLIGPATVVSSEKTYLGNGASTLHPLPVDARRIGGARLRLAVEGNYPDSFYVALLIVEGQPLGTVMAPGVFCGQGQGDFVVDSTQFGVWAADGVVNALVQNTALVTSTCPVNRHVVTLAYDTPGDSVGFGLVYRGLCRTRAMLVENHGTDVLHLSSVGADDPAYSVSMGSFDVAPGAAESLYVTLCPDRDGEIDAQLAIASDAGPATVALTGSGAEPPIAGISPDAFSASLHTGQTADLPLSLTNSGGAPLDFSAEIEYLVAPAAPRSPATARTTRPCAPSLVWGLRSPVTPGLATAARVGGRLPSPARIEGVLPPILTDPLGDGGPVDVVSMHGRSSGDSLRLSIEFGAPINPYDLGGAISLDVDQNPATGTQPYYPAIGQDIGAEYAVLLFNVPNGGVDLYSTVTGYYIGSYPASIDSLRLSFAIPLSALGGDDGAMDLDGVMGTQSYATDWFPDSGHATVTPASWLTLVPDHGSVAPGVSMPLTAHVDAHGLPGGNYSARIRLLSNDPVHDTLLVAADLHLTDAADLVVTPAALGFDSVFVGAVRAETLHVSNDGVLPLTLSGSSIDHPAYTAAALNEVLQPGGRRDLVVTFQPTGVGAANGTLTILSDDPDTPSLGVPLGGVGVEPPVITVAPDSLVAGVLVGEHADLTLDVGNTGAGNLHFTLTSVDDTPVLMSRSFSTSIVGSPARPTGDIAGRRGDDRRRVLTREETAGPVTAPRPGMFGRAAATRAASAFSFRDGFEDGNFDGWIDAGGASLAEVTNATAANGTVYSLHQSNAPAYQHFQGLAKDFGPITPAYMGFWVRPGSAVDATTYVVLRSSTGLEVIWFFATPDGHFYINGDSGGNQLFSFVPMTWYHIEYRNIDYVAKQLDYYVNGTLVQSGVPFRNPLDVVDVARLDIYNFTQGSQAWWDEFNIGSSPAASWIHFGTPSGIVPPGGHADVTTTLDAADLLGGHYFGSVLVASDDPLDAMHQVPVHLHVTGVPQIAVTGPPTVVSGSRDFYTSQATTVDSLPVTGPVGGGATFTLTVTGDYGDPGEIATLVVEGHPLGSIGPLGIDCVSGRRSFRVDAATFAAMASDLQVVAEVMNSEFVDPTCSVNRHTVEMRVDSPGDHLDFGSRYQGLCVAETLRVENPGTDVLIVTSISADDPAYSVAPTSFSLAPGGSKELPVMLCVDRLGPIGATLSIASNAGTATTALSATGIAAPVATVTPDSIGASLLSGHVVDQVLHVSNTGADTLRYQVSVEYPPSPGPAAGARPAGPRPARAAAPGPAWGASHATGVMGANPAVAATLPVAHRGRGAVGALPVAAVLRTPLPTRTQDDALPVVGTDPTGDGGAVDITTLRGAIHDDEVELQLEMASSINAFDFGGAISLDIDRNPLTGASPYYGLPGQDVGAEYWVTLFNLPYNEVDLYAASTGQYITSLPATVESRSFRFAIPLATLGSDGLGMDADVVVGNGFGPTDWLPDSGHVTVRRAWVTINPEQGSLSAGAALDHGVHLDATGLLGGDYHALLRLDSNDPEHPRIDVPVGIHVTGAPAIAARPHALDFGSVFLSASRRESLEVINHGTDALHVTGIVSSDPQFAPSPTSFTLAPGESAAVRVDFTPAADLPASGHLDIASDDPDSATIQVALTGSGRLAPHIQVTPDSLNASIALGDSSHQVITIANTGGSDLHFTIDLAPVTVPPTRVAAVARLVPRRPLRPEESPPPPTRLAPGARRASLEPPGRLHDDFEDGDDAGWINAGYGNLVEVTSLTAANGTHYSLHEHSYTEANHFSGAYHDLIPGQPESVSFWVRPDSSGYTGYFVLRDTSGVDAIWFSGGNGGFYVNGDMGGPSFYPYTGLTWYHIEFRNVSFVTKTFDLYVNDVFVQGNIPFRNWNMINSFARVDLYNYSAPADAWWDEIRIGGVSLSWLQVTPDQGTVGPGAHADLGVTMTTTGLSVGDYRAALAALSDDPAAPSVAIPVHLHVVGAPKIVWQPAALHFGRVFVGSTGHRTLEVANHGTETLHVTSIVSSDPQCDLLPTNFVLAPFESIGVTVGYTPAAADSMHAILTLTSNDTTQLAVQVAMDGVGAYPPNIGVSPDSLVTSLYSGGTGIVLMQIANTGDGPLEYRVDVEYTQAAASRPARAAASAVQHPSAPVVPWGSRPPVPAWARHVVPRASGGPTLRSVVPARVAAEVLPIVVADTVGDGAAVDASALRGAFGPDSLALEIDFATPMNSYDFNGIVALDTDRDPSTGAPMPYGSPAQDVGAEYMVYLFDVKYGVVEVFADSNGAFVGSYPATVAANSLRFAIPRAVLAGGTNGVDVDVAVGNNARITDLVPDTGHGTIGGRHWLTVAQDHGTVDAGQVKPVEAVFDADGLPGGDYHARVVVLSDDPDQGVIRLPVHLHTTSASDIAAPIVLDFGQLFVGGAAHRTLSVSNHGDLDLHVTGIQFSDPHASMVATPAVFTLAPAESIGVEIALTGAGLGSFATNLQIASDDPDESPFDVMLLGSVATPPDIDLPELSVDTQVKIGGVSSTPFAIDNLGPTDLVWSAEIVSAPQGAVIATAAASTGTAASRVDKTTPASAETRPPADQIRIMGPGTGQRPVTAVARLASRGSVTGVTAALAYQPPSLTLEEVLDSLEARSAYVTAAIPNRYDFTDGVTGHAIVDGGNDMFDLGNVLNTDLSGSLPYSDGIITTHAMFGPGGRYFTRKYPGLFVLAADLDGVSSFRITGDLGADGAGSVDAATLQVTQGGVHYRGYVKRVYGSGDASVNHLIIVRETPELTHAYATNTNDDYDEVTGLSSAGRLYDLLFSNWPGTRIDDSDMLAIMTRFVRLLPSRWLQVVPGGGVVPASGSQQVALQVDARDLSAGTYAESLVIHTNDPDEPRLAVPVTIHADTVTAVAMSLVSADADREAAHLVWYVVSPNGASGTVERREGGADWVRLGPVVADGGGYLRFEDRGVIAGHTYGYRLHLTTPEEAWTAEAQLTIPDMLVFALQGARPNPAGRELQIAFTLPDGAATTLELLDLAGRRLRSEDVGALGAGRHLVSLGGTHSLPAGIYLIRLTRVGQSFVTKAAIVH
ncbi:MAG: choice-of-anchor D domain-containing protein [Candidatus Eisenbacteria bacterium]